VKCLYNKQNNTWTLGDMKLSSRVQARSKISYAKSMRNIKSGRTAFGRRAVRNVWSFRIAKTTSFPSP
jgi:hypothetical protein